jgi:hypothetical protein
MSFASVGDRGQANAKTTGADLTMNPTATVQVGNFLIICIAWEIDYTGTPEGASWPSVAVHDSKGNLYTQLGGFSWESYVSIHIGHITTTLTTSDTITVHHRNPAHDAKAMTTWEFSYNTVYRWARFRDPNAGGDSGTTSWASPITLSAQESLIIQATSSKGPSTDTFTYDPDYTPMTKSGTTGGSDESNVTITAQFRIANVASDVASESVSATRKVDVVIVGLFEATFVADFPRFPVLDDFNRSEDPLDNGTWYTEPDPCTPAFGGGKLRAVSNQAAKSVAYPGGAGAQWWLEDFLGCYCESYVSMPIKGQAAVHMDGEGCGYNATAGGSAAHWMPVSAGYFPDDQITLGGQGNTGFIAGNPLRTWLDQADNQRFGIQRDSRTGEHFVHLWVNRGSGWEWMSAWRINPDIEPSGNPSQGKVGISVWGDPNTRLDDFGAGASDCPEFWAGMNWRSADRNTRALVGS